jgi:hypothetical protein
MQFEHTSKNYRDVATALITYLEAQLRHSKGRSEWTGINLGALQDFSIKGPKMSPYPKPDKSKRSGLKGQFLWDHMSCTDDDVIIIAESEWNSSPLELRHDFEKLLYTRCPIKLMMCGGWPKPEDIAKDLSKYAKKCSRNFGPGEVFILFCTGWIDEQGERRGKQVYKWQVPGEVCRNDGRKFNFQSDWE